MSRHPKSLGTRLREIREEIDAMLARETQCPGMAPVLYGGFVAHMATASDSLMAAASVAFEAEVDALRAEVRTA